MIESLGKDLWVVRKPMRMPGMEIGSRMTIVRLTDGSLWIHSPVAWDEKLGREVEALGKIRYLVAPNPYHHLFLKGWQERSPGAQIYGVKALERKRSDLRFAGWVDGGGRPPWQDEIAHHILVAGPKLTESIYFHRASRTLILTDFAFNIRKARSPLERFTFKVFGIWNRFGPSRLMMTVVAKDKNACRAAVERCLAWDFDKIVVAHGEVVTEDAKAIFKRQMTF